MYYLYDFTAGEKVYRSECETQSEADVLARSMSRGNEKRNAHVIAVLDEEHNTYEAFFHNGTLFEKR